MHIAETRRFRPNVPRPPVDEWNRRVLLARKRIFTLMNRANLLSHPTSVLGTAVLLTIVSLGMAQTAPPTTSWTSVGETNTSRPDYSQLQYWMMAAQNPTAPVDVLFIHTTTLRI